MHVIIRIVCIIVSIACIGIGSCFTSVQVGLQDIEYKKKYKGNELELQYAVEEHLYPPAICVTVVQSEEPMHLRLHKLILLHVYGTNKGTLTFPIEVLEMKEGMS